MDIPALRQCHQGISRRFSSPVEAVLSLAAIQAQEYRAALWAIGLRLSASTEPAVAAAIAQGEIVRTWPMRGTYHFVAANDVRWMLQLLGPRAMAAAARRHRQLELEEADFGRSLDVCIQKLAGGRRLSRRGLYRALEAEGISCAGQRGIHIIQHLAHQGLICYGPREGNEPTLVLLDEWVAAAKSFDREEALAEVAVRYFRGHGPATARDLAWWTGLSLSECRTGIALAGRRLAERDFGGRQYFLDAESAAEPGGREAASLLPAFDEYLVGYADRSAVLETQDARSVNAGGGLLSPTVVIDGRVAGTWKRLPANDGLRLSLKPFRPLSATEAGGVESEARRLAAFLGLTFAGVSLAE